MYVRFDTVELAASPVEFSCLCNQCSLSAGSIMGNALALPIAGVLCEYGFSEGWDSVFYVIGQCSLIAFHCFSGNSVQL